MWGIIPAAGMGSRIQPLAFSKEFLPVGSRLDGDRERPRAVSEYLIERMLRAGADKLCFVISPGKSDILEYYGAGVGSADVCYVIQPEAGGLCDALFRALPFVTPEEPVLIGLPDTIWFPEEGLRSLPSDALSFLLFPVERPEFFDAVVTDDVGRVKEIQVKQFDAKSNWIWGGSRCPAACSTSCTRSGSSGTSATSTSVLNGYREAIKLLTARPADSSTNVEQRPVSRDPMGSAPFRSTAVR